MAKDLQPSGQELGLMVEALYDAMFFRDARSGVPTMFGDSNKRDRDNVAEYQPFAVKLRGKR
jgi:hypothetical protein